MNIKIIKSKIEWDDKVLQSAGSFLQAWNWGEVFVKEGQQVERLEARNTKAQIVFSKLPFGLKYAISTGGPIGELDGLPHLIAYFKKQGSVFWRLEPVAELPTLSGKLVKSIDVTPRATAILDLSKPESELLTSMHKKTRYSIRIAAKKKLEVNELRDFAAFWELMKKTGQRGGFRLHSKDHYQKVFESNLSKWLVAEYNNKPVAVVALIGFGDTLTYLYGASDYNSRSLMAPYLLQWEAIKFGKKEGYKKYDFFGIAPANESRANARSERGEGRRNPSWLEEGKYGYDQKHQYAGVTRFKLGFGGEVVENAGTYDLVLSKSKYSLYKVFRKAKRLF